MDAQKFIIIDTWNGEGYSDSRAGIKTFNDLQEVKDHAYSVALQSIGHSDEYALSHVDKAYRYDLSWNDEIWEDSGAIHYLPYSGQYAVKIKPLSNSFEIIETEADYNALIKSYIKTCTDEDDLKLLKDGEEQNNCFHCIEGEDVILVIIHQPAEDKELISRLEFYDSGDGVSQEIWADKANKNLYNVPIEIVRNWKEITKIEQN